MGRRVAVMRYSVLQCAALEYWVSMVGPCLYAVVRQTPLAVEEPVLYVEWSRQVVTRSGSGLSVVLAQTLETAGVTCRNISACVTAQGLRAF